MPFEVKARIDDQTVTATAETVDKAFAKAVEWHVVNKFTDVSISDGINSYSIDEFSAALGNGH